jgi:hypothetical protein
LTRIVVHPTEGTIPPFERPGSGIRAGQQGPLFEGGNEYLRKNFPRLDFIKTATIIRR